MQERSWPTPRQSRRCSPTPRQLRLYVLGLRGLHSVCLTLTFNARAQGYEVAQWNAAWLLDRHIATGAPSTSGPWRDTVAYTLEAPSEGGDSSDSPSDGGDSSADNEDGEVSVERASESAALRLFEKSAQLGHVASHLRMGDYHYYGRAGLEPDPTKAMDHYQAAAERKNPQVMVVPASACSLLTHHHHLVCCMCVCGGCFVCCCAGCVGNVAGHVQHGSHA